MCLDCEIFFATWHIWLYTCETSCGIGGVKRKAIAILFHALMKRWLRCLTLVRPGDRDNDGEIPEHQQTTGKELPPLFGVRPIEERCQASNDENEVPNPTEGDHHRVEPPYLTRMQKRPKRDGTRLHEVSQEEIETVPGNRDGEACAKCKDVVAARENDDRDVDE
jgi:hypothetical protein